ncbi:hypothetical protein N0V93_000286 [Gnomoniopsis smithogilvyi]|uniref:Uncharacterized protein n=1 Tax=Gnomoniopsis smithogilvyi TaxID=1191159 RepID=A0A9W8YZX4_9PEZI|nr:hypothetical protein N0V93_000286 [Gnomoniopsis smithogilvyi]
MSGTGCSDTSKAVSPQDNQIREQYEKNHPIIYPDLETEHNRRGLVDAHANRVNPVDPSGSKVEMSHASLVPSNAKAKADDMDSYTASQSEPEAKEREKPGEEDINNDPITGGLGHGLVSWPPKRRSNPYEYHYTEGDEWQQAGDTSAAKRRCGGGSASETQDSGSGAGPSGTRSQINSKFN